MTIKLVTVTPPPEEEGQASVYDISLPDELQAGTWITGHIDVKNVGAVSDEIRCLFTTQWDGKSYTTPGSIVGVGQIMRSTVPEGLIAMPEIDATITIKGQHLEAGVWVTDDTKTH